MRVILIFYPSQLLLETKRNTSMHLNRFKNGFLELVMAELQGHVLGLKSRFPLTDFVIIIQPIFTEGLY